MEISVVTRRLIESLSKFWLVWIWSYLILGGVSMMSGNTNFLAAAVDSPVPSWFKLLFLNVPLQIALALTALILFARTANDQPSGITITLSFAATLLMGVNFMTAIWLLF